MDVFEAMTNMRAMRRLKPDAVPRDVLESIVHYAIHAPSGSNAQGWHFIVVTDAAKRAQLGEIYRKAVDFYLLRINTKPEPHQTEDEWRRMVAAVRWQGDHLGACPALVFACLKGGGAADYSNALVAKSLTASIYPAVQNLLLACRAHGLGATLTTLHLMFEDEVKAILGMPASAGTFAMIPVGYPMGNFGPTKRQPLEDVLSWDSWE
ncbi:MAG: nitroreductase family protein [Dehalococcoidia bacterium]